MKQFPSSLALFAALLLAFGCTPSPFAADAQGNAIVNGGFEELKDGLPTGWTRDAQSARKGDARVVQEHATSGTQALRLTPNANNIDSEKSTMPLALGQGFEGRQLSGTTLYVSGSLLARGGATAVIAVYAHRTDGQVLGVRLTQGSDAPAMMEQRGRLVIPDDGKTKFVVLICAVEGTKGVAFFDDVRLSTSLPAAAAGPRGPLEGRGAALEAEVTVDAKRVIRTIPSTLYGTNLEWVWEGNGLWNARERNLDPQITRLAKDLGVSMLRFPGGVFADFYDWRNGTGAQATRPTTPHMPGPGDSRHSFGTDEALQLSREIGAPLLVTVNVATGTAGDAGAWVRYVAQRIRQDPKIPRVALWELGNENYNRGGMPHLEQATLAPEAYAKRFVDFARAMRQADPEVRLAAISDANLGTRAPHGYADWDKKVLRLIGREIDYLSVHNAYAPTLATDQGEDLRTVYAAMLAAPQLVRRSLDEVTAQIKLAVPERAGKIRIAVTEWGPAFQITPHGRYVDHVKTLGSALYVASVMKVFIESPTVEVANFFKLVDPLWSGSIGKRGDAYVPTAPYFALQLYSRHFGERLVHSETRSPTFSTTAVGWIDAVRDVPYLDVVASVGASGSSLHLLGINKHFDRDIRTRIRLTGFVPRAEGQTWTLSGAGLDAHTGTDVFRAPGFKWARQEEDRDNPRFHKGGPDEVAVRQSKTSKFDGTFEYVFPARSATMLVLPGGG
jgi:alpha-N-arabinofuranosidase